MATIEELPIPSDLTDISLDWAIEQLQKYILDAEYVLNIAATDEIEIYKIHSDGA